MRRSLVSAVKNIPLGTVLASALLLVALLLPGCAPVPVDDELIEGSECMFDSDCQSGNCWQEASEETATCKSTPPPADV